MLFRVNPAKTFNIPPENVTVVSTKGGSDTRPMTSIPPGTLNHPPQAAGKLPEIGSGFGKSIRNFERATEEKDEVEIKAWSG